MEQMERIETFFASFASSENVVRSLLRLLAEIDTEKRPELKVDRDMIITFVEVLL